MRIDYQNSGSTQQPVMPAQTRMRDARTPKRPVLRILVLLLLIAAGAGAYWWYARLGAVYTYGIVAARMTPYYAPFEGVVSDLELDRGDHVAQGETLFVLTAAQPENVRDAQDALLGEIDRQKARAEQARENLVAQAEKEVERLQAVVEDEEIRARAAVEAARLEAAKREEVYRARAGRLDRVEDLHALGAAVQSDVDAARTAARVARREWDQARQALQAAEQRTLTSAAALEKAQLEYERLRDGDPVDTAALERGRVELAVAQTRPAAATIQSLFDGVVLEVGAINGAQVEDGRVVANIATRDNIWVEAYIPPEDARRVEAGASAKLYFPGEPEPIPGVIAEHSGAAVRVPEILRDKLPNQIMGVYTRIEFTPPDGFPVVPGARVRIVIGDETAA